MKHLKKYMARYKWDCFLAPAFKMLEACFDLFVPVLIARMINIGIGQNDRAYIIKCAILLIVLAVIGLLFSFTAQYFSARAATGTAAMIRHDLFEHIMKLGASETDQIGASTLITRMTSDVNQVQNGLNLFLRLFLRSPFIVFGALIMAFMINRRISIIFAVGIIVLTIIIFVIMRFTYPGYKGIQSLLDQVTGITRENLSGVRVVRAFGQEEHETKQFFEANAALTKKQSSVGHISALLNPLTYIVINLSIVAILYTGAVYVNTGIILSGEVIALINYMSQILVELVKLANLIVSVSKAMASMDRVGSVLDTPISMQYVKSAVGNEHENVNEHMNDHVQYNLIEMKNVSFRYVGAGEDSLTDISFHVKRGSTIGIIGGTGSGKSTLMHLLMRFYDVSQGTILVDGKDIRCWDKNKLHTKLAIVMQKAQLFSGTIRSNMLMGNPAATDEDIWEALRIAQAADFVKAGDHGLDAAVEQGGRNFSGGQKQRLTIARALVRKPEILILDDSASALDLVTDAALRKALKELPESITVLIVSQRTASIRNADEILVLDDGKLVDHASHDILLGRCSIYREIYESQFKKEEGI